MEKPVKVANVDGQLHLDPCGRKDAMSRQAEEAVLWDCVQ